ncbi:MAG: GTPase HflX [Candidatus Omnitrophica bacterium]|nr:GTPase HflX [Candidatus Omnitrophota bacterium]
MPQVKTPVYQFPERSGPKELGTPFKRIVVVQVVPPNLPAEEGEDQFEEISRLVETLDGQVVGHVVQRRSAPHREYFVGPGKADQIGTLCDERLADTVLIDGRLSPNQIAHLEHETGSHVMDRTELILEIFARRAKTAEAKLQVELAYLNYFNPKMDRSTTTRAYRGGLRGFGESALGKKAQAMRARADLLREKIEKLKKQGESRVRNRAGQWTVALVGYTNAGKSTLLNALSGESVYADDRLFATLDTTTRRVHLKDSRIALFSDTVGFIRRLPHELVASFHSTLSEALAANLLVHVADASSPTLRAQMETVEKTLEELGAEDQRVLLAFNKIDAADSETLDHLRGRFPEAVFLSARSREGLPELRQAVYDSLSTRGSDGRGGREFPATA